MGEVSKEDLEKYAQELFDSIMDYNVAIIGIRLKLKSLSKKDYLYFIDVLTKIAKQSDRWIELSSEYRKEIVKILYGRLASMKAELEV